jgi:hypothetical protein
MIEMGMIGTKHVPEELNDLNRLPTVVSVDSVTVVSASFLAADAAESSAACSSTVFAVPPTPSLTNSLPVPISNILDKSLSINSSGTCFVPITPISYISVFAKLSVMYFAGHNPGISMLGGLAVVSVTEPLALPWVALGTATPFILGYRVVGDNIVISQAPKYI